jgi:uncharacterized integral membrane protein
MRLAQAIFIILLFFFTIAFCLQNMDNVTLHYYGLVDNISAPLFVVVLASVFLGIIIGIIGGGLTTIRLRLQLRRQTKEAEELRDIIPLSFYPIEIARTYRHDGLL